MLRWLIVAATVSVLAGIGTPRAHAGRCQHADSARVCASSGDGGDDGHLDSTPDGQRPSERPKGATVTPSNRRPSETALPPRYVPRDPTPPLEIPPCRNWHRCRVG